MGVDSYQDNDFLKVYGFADYETRYFAMLHNAVAIKGDKALEGGKPIKATKYYNNLLNVDIPHCPVNFNLPPALFQTLSQRMSNLYSSQKLLDDLFTTDTLFTKEGLDIVVGLIDQQCNEQKVSYLPGGYKNLKGGHFAGLKIRKLENGKYALSYINQGEGVDYHQQVTQNATKTKYSHQSDEYEIDLNTDSGREYLQKMLQLSYDKQRNEFNDDYINQYSSDDFMGLLILYGEKLPPPPLNKLKEKAATIQRTGTCPMTTAHAIARDILIDMDVNLKQRKRYHFVIKLRSLIVEFDAYKNKKSSLPILEAALKEFNVRMNKFYRNVLTDDEYNQCAKLEAIIRTQIAEDKKTIEQQKCADRPYPTQAGDAPIYRDNIFDESKLKAAASKKEIAENIDTKNQLEINPENIKNVFIFNTTMGDFKNSFQKYYNIFNALPHCTGETEDLFWDKVPQADIKTIIDSISNLIAQLEPNSNADSLERAKYFAFSLMAYDIIAQLAPRDERFKLGDTYTLGLDDVYSHSYDFNNPEIYYTVKRIAQNFENRANHKMRVFTNAVNYDNQYDNTINYVINILLSDRQRIAIAKARMKEENQQNVEYADHELFDYLIKHIDMADDNGHPILDQAIRNIVASVGRVNLLGNYVRTIETMLYGELEPKYVREGSVWYFSETPFVFGLKRQNSWDIERYTKHLPKLESEPQEQHKTQYKDFSENTIYHPSEHMLELRTKSESYLYKPYDFPYQFKVSGSLQPSSKAWQVQKDQVSFYEELNEAFRLIECSPNFQIVKTFDWATNNIDILNNRDVRTRISELLFQYGKLDNALAYQLATTMQNMQQFLSVLLAHCQHEAIDDIELHIWAANLAIDLRYYVEVAAKLYGFSIASYTLPSFKTLLVKDLQNENDADLKSRIASQIICTYRNRQAPTLEDCCLILVCRVAANLGDSAKVSEEQWRKLQSIILTTIQTHQTEAEKLLNQYMRDYNISAQDNWHLKSFRLQQQDNPLYIDLNAGVMQEIGENKTFRERTLRTVADNKALLDTLAIDTKNLKLLYSVTPVEGRSQNKLQSEDGKWEFSYTSHSMRGTDTVFRIDTIYQNITIEGVTSKFKLLDKDKKQIEAFFDSKNPFESKNYIGHNYEYWQSEDDDDLIFVRNKKDNIAYSFSKEANYLLVNWPADEIIDVNDLQKISNNKNNAPIIIKHGDRLLMYGYSNNAWMITELDTSNEAFMIEVKALPFPDIEVSLDRLHLYQEKLNDIDNPKKIAQLKEFIEHEQEKIEEALKNRRFKTNYLLAGNLKENIRQQIVKGHTVKKNKAISQLEMQPNGEWQRNHQTDKQLLNLLLPQTDLEREWAQRLAAKFGVTNIRAIAELNQDKTKWEVERIEHLLLKLSFTIDKEKRLLCDEMPGYFLSTQTSIEALHGFPGIIILENAAGHKKYMIPAFHVAEGEANNAFRTEDILDTKTLCNDSRPYYTYTLDQNGELKSDTVEENLYLAVLYRNLGDFERAIHYLQQCKKHEKIDANIGAIATQILTRKIHSPVAVAFDLKLISYLREQQSKWSRDKKNSQIKPYEEPPLLHEHIYNLLDYYQKTSSSYKLDVMIIPNNCRLTEHELQQLNELHRIGEEIKKLQALTGVTISPIKRLEDAARLPSKLLEEERYWPQYVNRYLNFDRKAIKATAVLEKLTTPRLYSNEGNYATCWYLLRNFHHLFKEVISNDPNRIANVNRILFTLLQNDAKPENELYVLVALLTFTREFSQYFVDLTVPDDNLKLVTEIGKIFYQHREDLKNMRVHLFDVPAHKQQLLKEDSFQSDFTPQPVDYNLAALQYEAACKQPLTSFANKYFAPQQVPIARDAFQLDLSGFDTPSLLETKIFNQLKSGHEQNKKKLKTVYAPRGTQNLDELKNELLILKQNDEKELQRLTEALLTNANATPLDDAHASPGDHAKANNLIQARLSGNKHRLEMNDLFTALLHKNPQILTEQNPFLQQNDVEKLLAQLVDCALIATRIAQNKQALDLIDDKHEFPEKEKYKEQLLAAVLDKSRVYAIKDYPEFLLYEYATNRLLRDDQVNVLITLINLIEDKTANQVDIHHALLQFAAGGGKTSVIIPILAKRFARAGLMPVIINTNELYEIGLEDIPKSLQTSFKQNLEVIERELDYKWTKEDLLRLLADLKRWQQEGKCLLLKSITWHSINITMKAAYFKNDMPLAKAAQDVLEFFKTNTVKLEDECHIVSDPMQQCIRTDGAPLKIPGKQLEFLMRCYDYLLGRAASDTQIAELAGIKTKRKSPISADELVQLQRNLASALSNEPLFNTINRQALYSYFTQTDKKRPQWLEKLCQDGKSGRELANIVVLARAFLHTHMPHILSLQYQKDFGRSIHDGDLTVAPKHEGNPVTSHFGDPMLVAALTIQLYEEGGLLPEQVDQLLLQLIKEHRKERKWNTNIKVPTQGEIWLRQIIPTFKSFSELTVKMKENLRTDALLTTHHAAIQKYLREFALPQIQVPPKRITSTAAEMQAGFNRSIMFSATPGLPETYPAFLDSTKNCFLEESFEAQVIDTLLQEQNKGVCILKKSQDPQEFFAQFHPDTLAKMHTIIDRGALLTEYDPAEVIMGYLGLDKESIYADAAAYFAKQQKDSKQKMQLVASAPNIKSKEIAGAGLVEELKKQGIDPEEVLLFLFLDISKATGTDILRTYQNNAGLTIGKEQTLTETIQAAMRQRKLLEKDAQTITWIMFQELYRAIYTKTQQDTFDRKKLIYWMIKNEAKEVENKIINRAYQGIEQAVKEVVWNEIKNDPKQFAKYETALEEQQAHEPYNLYELESNKNNTETVLTNYVEEMLTKFNLTKGALPAATIERVQKIITETHLLIAQLEDQPKSDAKADIGVEVQQEMQQMSNEEEEMEQEQRIKTKNDTMRDFVLAVETYDDQNDSLAVIFNIDNKGQASRYRIPQFDQCEEILQPDLLLCPEHFKVIEWQGQNHEKEVVIQALKPITNLLVQIMPDHQMRFVACTAAGMEFYSNQIKNNKHDGSYPAYAIISTQGSVLYHSDNIALAELNALIASEQSQKMQTYAHFLNGEISNPLLLSQIIKQQGWDQPQYTRLAQAIANIHVSRQPVRLVGDEVLESFCGWNDKKQFVITKDQNINEPTAENDIYLQPLQPVTHLEKHLENTFVAPSFPQRALANDLFGEKLQPIKPIAIRKAVEVKDPTIVTLNEVKEPEIVVHPEMVAIPNMTLEETILAAENTRLAHQLLIAHFKALNLENSYSQFINLLQNPKIMDKLVAYKSSDLFGKLNTELWQETLKKIRQNALTQLKNKMSTLSSNKEKLDLLFEARKQPIFSSHRSNYVLSGAFGRTKTIKDVIDVEIKEIQQLEKVTHKPK